MRESERQQARQNERDSTSRSLGSRFPRLRSIPPPSLASLFPPPPSTVRAPAVPHAGRRSSSDPRVLLFQYLSLSLSASVSRTPIVSPSRSHSRADSSTSPSNDSPSLPLVYFLSPSRSFSVRLAFLHVQQDVAAISQRVYTRVLIIAENGRAEKEEASAQRANGQM